MRKLIDLNKKWYVFYTYPKCEKKIHSWLLENNFESLLPLVWVNRKWSDRIKRLNLPMFPNYIFVKIEYDDIFKVLKNDKVIYCLKYNKTYAYIREEVIDKIKLFSESDVCLKICTELNEGDLVIVMKGPLTGMEGTLVKQSKDLYFCVRIELLSRSILVNIKESDIKKIN